MRLGFSEAGEGKFFHKNRGHREPIRDSQFWSGRRKNFTIRNIINLLLLQVLFLGNLSYFYGSSYSDAVNVHHFKILLVDYDGGIVGQSLNATYQRLKGLGFPTVEAVSVDEYPTVEALRNKVCRDSGIWGAVFTHSGASDRLADAIQGGQAAQSYDPEESMTYIWNGIRYSSTSLGAISGNLETLISESGASYAEINGSYAYSVVNGSDPAATRVLATPFVPSSINLMPSTQGPRVLYNTVTIVFTVLSQFFFIMGLNGIAMALGMFTRLSVLHNCIIRFSSSLVYSFCLGATITGAIWAFRDEWSVQASQGVETWLCISFVCQIHYLIVETVTGFIKQQFFPFFVMSWVILNVSSTVTPMVLMPGFYHWVYAVPGFELYQLLVTIWSHGCAPQLSTALPILFSWWVAGFFGATCSMIRKCNAATKLEAEEEKEEKDLEKIVTRGQSGSESSTLAAEEAEGQTDALERLRSRAGGTPAVPDVLYWSSRTPFSDSLGLTPVRTLPSRPKPHHLSASQQV